MKDGDNIVKIAKALKDQLQNEIAIKVSNFTRDTGLEVDSINLMRTKITGDSGEVLSIHYKTYIDISL
jgi:hypothetical protein